MVCLELQKLADARRPGLTGVYFINIYVYIYLFIYIRAFDDLNHHLAQPTFTYISYMSVLKINQKQ
jgi:hypothetical protein